MNILHVTAQKPSSTGSGVYLTQLARAIGGLSLSGSQPSGAAGSPGIRQGVLAGVYITDIPELESSFSYGTDGDGIRLYPVFFDSGALPFPIFGMSDVMPYPSSQYKQMTDDQLQAFEEAFLAMTENAFRELKPDVILCHHLYLLTALIRKHFPDVQVYGFCHNTDLMQRRSHDLAAELIDTQIPRLNGVFALHEEQKREITALYDIGPEKVHIVGAGYDPAVFYPAGDAGTAARAAETGDAAHPTRLIFAGKVSRAKGAHTLLRILQRMDSARDYELTLAGGSGNIEEQKESQALAAVCPYPVCFTGSVSQPALADLYRESDIFVLPSLSEGLPLSVIEALACGLKVVMTDLPGAHGFFDDLLPDAPVTYVAPPDSCKDGKRQTDDESAMADYEGRFAQAISDAADAPSSPSPDMSGLTWQAIAARICKAVH